MSSPHRFVWLLLAVVISSLNTTPAESQQPAQAHAKPAVDLFGDPLPPGTLARMGTIRLRPGAPPGHFVFSSDSKQLFCFAGGHGSADALVRYDVASGKELQRVHLLDSRVPCASMTPDGRGLAVVLLVPGEKDYYLWEFTDPKSRVPRPDSPLRANTSYREMHFNISPDGCWVASAGRYSGEAEGPVEVRPWTSGRLLVDLKPVQSWKLPDTECSAVEFTHDSKQLLAKCRKSEQPNGDFRRFDLKSGKHQQVPGVEYKFHYSMAHALSPQGVLALGLSEKNGRLINLASGKDSETLPFPVVNDKGKIAGLSALTFSADGKFLAAGDWDGWLRLWDVAKQHVAWQFAGNQYEMRSLAFSPDGRWLASAGSDGLIRLWDVAKGKEAHVLPALQGYPWRLEMSHDGRTAVTASNSDRRLRQWDIGTGRLLREITHDLPFHDTGFVPGTDELIVAHGKRLDRWNLAENRLEPIQLEKGEVVTGLFRFSADGTTLVSTQQAEVRVWDWPRKKLCRRWSLDNPPNPQESIEVVSLAVTRDGGKALIHAWHWKKAGGLEKRSATFWNTRVGKTLSLQISNQDAGDVTEFNNHVAFTHDEDGVIMCMFDSSGGAARESLRWIDLSSGKLRRKFVPPTNPRNLQHRIADNVAFSPDGRTLASAERDHTVILYEAASGLPRRVLEGHRNDVSRLAFTPDGRRLVTFSEDLTGLVWDLSLAPAAPRKLSKSELADAWTDLADRVDGAKVHRTMVTLAGDPQGAIALLRKQIQPARAPDAKHLARLLADLDSDIFNVRAKAFAELDGLGDGVAGFLRDRLKQDMSLEMRRRVESLLEKHDPANLPPDRLREIRALEVLENLGGSTAREVLEGLAQGNPAATLTRAARAAVGRLNGIAP